MKKINNIDTWDRCGVWIDTLHDGWMTWPITTAICGQIFCLLSCSRNKWNWSLVSTYKEHSDFVMRLLRSALNSLFSLLHVCVCSCVFVHDVSSICPLMHWITKTHSHHNTLEEMKCYKGPCCRMSLLLTHTFLLLSSLCVLDSRRLENVCQILRSLSIFNEYAIRYRTNV